MDGNKSEFSGAAAFEKAAAFGDAGAQRRLVKKRLLVVLIGAGLSLFLSRSGVLSLFFLVPLGFVAFRYGFRVAWCTVASVIAANTLALVGGALSIGVPLHTLFFNMFYFAAVTSVFMCILKPPTLFLHKTHPVLRLVAGSLVVSLLLIGMFLRAAASPGFLEQFALLANAALERQASGGYDVVQRALMAEIQAVDVLLFAQTIVLRGGALAAASFLFFASRQMSILFARIFSRSRAPNSGGFTHQRGDFKTAPQMIWVFSGALFLTVLTNMAGRQLPQIILWNILVFCAILYLAQGFGIIRFFIAKPAVTPFLKLLLSVLFVLLLLSPGINAMLLSGVALLGIAENWVPFRVPKSNRPPSTPKAGDE